MAVIKYRVEVYTANEPGADTEAELFLQLFGSHGDSGKRVLYNCLNNKKNQFQEGQMDLFEIEAVELQEIEKVIMGHEEKGKGTFSHKNMSCVIMEFNTNNINQLLCSIILLYGYHFVSRCRLEM